MTSSFSMDHRISEILGPDPEHFETLISNLMTPSNEQRKEAESEFNLCKKTDLNALVDKLGNLLEYSPDIDARAMSAILLGNIFKQSKSTQSRVKRCLLNCVENTQNKTIIKILGYTISMLEPDRVVANFFLDRVASNDSSLQESALLIFPQLVQYVMASKVPYITRVHDDFMNCLGNVGSAEVRIAALIAATSFIQCLTSTSSRFQDLLPAMMRCLAEVLTQKVDEVMTRKALVLLIELAGTEPSFFTGHLVEVVGSMLQIAEAESLEEGTRHLAIEFLITLAEARKQPPGMMRDLSQLIISRLFAILMRMLLDIEDEAEWNSAENEDENVGESSNSIVGQECLHRLATALGGNTIVPVAYEQLTAYLAAPEWQKHLAALVALAQIAKGRSKVMIRNLEQVVTMVLKSFKDPHPRVRWAAINVIGQLSTYVGPSLQVRYQDRVLKALLASARDDINPRSVQARAVSAVLHFSSHSPNLDGIMLNKLLLLPPIDPIIRVLQLANSLEESTDVQIRDSSAIKLSEMFEEPFALTLDLFQRKLLRCVEKEDDTTVMKSLCHTIATFFNVLCIKTGWPELFYSVKQWVLGDNDLLKEAAMLILGLLRFLKKHPISWEVYCACLENASADIRIAAFGAAIGYIRFPHKDMDSSVQDMDSNLVHAMTRVLTNGLNEGEEVTTQKALKLLNEWAHQIKHPWFSDFESYDSHGVVFSTSKKFDYPPLVGWLGLLSVPRLGGQRALQCGGDIIAQFPNLMWHRVQTAGNRNDYESYDTESYDTESYDTKTMDGLDTDTMDGLDTDTTTTTTTTQSYRDYFSESQLVGFVSSAIEIAESQCLNETKHLAIDFMIALGERSVSHPELMTNKLFGILMSDIKNEVASWAENEDDDAGESSNFSVLLKFLDRLAFRLDEDSVAWPKLEKYFGASDWRKRVIAINILALAQISKVYLKVTKKSFDQLVTMVLDLFQDSHYRVKLAAIHATCQLSTDLDPDMQLQYHRLVLPAIYDDRDSCVRLAAINATGQLSTDLGPNLQFQYNSHVLPALAKAICDFKYPQVQELAASAVINVSKHFLSIIKDNLLSWTPYLIEIVDALLEFRRRDDSASYQTRSLAIKDLVELFPPGTWSQLGLGFDVEE